MGCIHKLWTDENKDTPFFLFLLSSIKQRTDVGESPKAGYPRGPLGFGIASHSAEHQKMGVWNMRRGGHVRFCRLDSRKLIIGMVGKGL